MPEKNDGDDWPEYRRLIVNNLQELKECSVKQALSLGCIDKTLSTLTNHMDDHMARTAAAEKRIEMLQDDIEPIKKLSWLAGLFAKIGTGLATLSGALWAVCEVIKNIKHL